MPTSVGPISSQVRSQPQVAPLARPVVVGGLALGVLGVSSAAVLTTFVLGTPPVVELALAIAFWRCLGGAVALAPFAVRARRAYPLGRADGRLLAWSGLFLAVHFALFLGSLGLTTVASATTLVTTAPVFVALGGIRWLDEHPSRATWVGMAVSMAGAVGLGLADLADLDLGPRALLGDVAALLAAVAMAAYLLVGRRVRARVHASTYSGGVYATAAVVLLGACLALGVPLWGYSTAQWLGIVGIVVGPQLLGHTVFNTLLSSVPATTVSVVALAEPVLATLLAWAFLAQVPAPATWLAAPVVLAGLVVAVRGGRRRPPRPT